MTSTKLVSSLRLLYHLTDATFPEISHKEFQNLQEILDNNNVAIEKLLQYLAPNCKEMLERCTWKGQQTPCESLFEQIKTSSGFCCSFNYFAMKSNSFNK